MQIAIISGSTRNNSQSRRVSNYLSDSLKKNNVESVLVDLNEKRLPLYDDAKQGDWEPLWKEISDSLNKSDGFIFVSPEWDGMFSVGIHNMFYYVDKELADKPVLAVGVSSGRGGRYPLQQMRTMGYKNKRFVIIPESIFFEHVKEKLADGILSDEWLEGRVEYALKVLIEYAKSLSLVRQSGVIDYEKFPNGL